MKKNSIVKSPEYVTRRTRVLKHLFPDVAKQIIQHDLSVLAARGHENRQYYSATLKTPEEFPELWKSQN